MDDAFFAETAGNAGEQNWPFSERLSYCPE
jgi:hypothetical protein